MLIKKMFKIIKLLTFIFFLIMSVAHSNETSFNTWLNDFKKRAIETGISKVNLEPLFPGVPVNVIPSAKPYVVFEVVNPNS